MRALALDRGRKSGSSGVAASAHAAGSGPSSPNGRCTPTATSRLLFDIYGDPSRRALDCVEMTPESAP